jgi:hypothetical protein
MCRSLTSLCLAALAVALLPALYAQNSTPKAAPAACPSTATFDQLTKALDAAISGPANKDRTCFRALFLPEARLIPLRRMPDGSYPPRILTVDDWINTVAKLGAESFVEKQVKVETQSYGHMAHLWSTYETFGTDGNRIDRGINSIQAIYDGKQWKIMEIVWEAERPTEKVPEKYLQ